MGCMRDMVVSYCLCMYILIKLIHAESFEQRIHGYAPEQGQQLRLVSEVPGLFSVPAILAGLFGGGLLQIARADADEVFV